MRPVGVTMEVDPVVGADGYTIDLNLAPEVVEFDGFINYGSPITVPDPAGGPGAPPVTLTQNVINQPVFSIRKVQTAVTVWDGQTVALGGLILGRLFQSKVEDHFKRNLMIFVTAKLIDPSGQTIRLQQTAEDDANPLLPAIGAP
jgi:general secretion pathway protein D